MTKNSSVFTHDDEDLISLLPSYASPATILMGNKLPCHDAKIERQPTEYLLEMLKRQSWVEGLYVRKEDLNKIKRYKNADGSYKNDFNENQFLKWVEHIHENTAVCDMEDKTVGKGVFIPPGKKLPKATFIISSGIIKLDPSIQEFETKNHCSALQNLNCPKKTIYGFIDPEKKGGILDLINHAPEKEEITNFKFKNHVIKEYVATANLKSTIKFYNGYAIMGLEAFEDIHGGEQGKQLLWSYAQSCEYLSHSAFTSNQKSILLFDNRSDHNGEIVDTSNYILTDINIFIDTQEPILLNVGSWTRWELMENSPASELILSIEDPFSSNQSAATPYSISYGSLQKYLKQNPLAERIIIKVAGARGQRSDRFRHLCQESLY